MHNLELDRLDILKIKRDIKYLRQITYYSQSKACLFFFLNCGPEKYTQITGKNIYVRREDKEWDREGQALNTLVTFYFLIKTIRSKYYKNLNILNLNDRHVSDCNLMLFHIFVLIIYLKYS